MGKSSRRRRRRGSRKSNDLEVEDVEGLVLPDSDSEPESEPAIEIERDPGKRRYMLERLVQAHEKGKSSGRESSYLERLFGNDEAWRRSWLMLKAPGLAAMELEDGWDGGWAHIFAASALWMDEEALGEFMVSEVIPGRDRITAGQLRDLVVELGRQDFERATDLGDLDEESAFSDVRNFLAGVDALLQPDDLEAVELFFRVSEDSVFYQMAEFYMELIDRGEADELDFWRDKLSTPTIRAKIWASWLAISTERALEEWEDWFDESDAPAPIAELREILSVVE